MKNSQKYSIYAFNIIDFNQLYDGIAAVEYYTGKDTEL